MDSLSDGGEVGDRGGRKEWVDVRVRKGRDGPLDDNGDPTRGPLVVTTLTLSKWEVGD